MTETPAVSHTATITLPPTLPLLNSNQRLHWAAKARRTRIIREATAWETRRLGLPRMHRVRVTAVIRPASNRRFDPHNLQPSIKAAIDGLVDAGLIADDDASRVVEVAFTAGEKTSTGRRLELRVEELAP